MGHFLHGATNLTQVPEAVDRELAEIEKRIADLRARRVCAGWDPVGPIGRRAWTARFALELDTISECLDTLAMYTTENGR